MRVENENTEEDRGFLIILFAAVVGAICLGLIAANIDGDDEPAPATTTVDGHGHEDEGEPDPDAPPPPTVTIQTLPAGQVPCAVAQVEGCVTVP